jgi:tRNA-dihydrouridine synthase A
MLLARRVAQRKRSDVAQMLLYRTAELPLAVQLGGDDHNHIMSASRKCQEAGFSEINLNLGCPAGTAHERNFGATLMKPPLGKLTALARKMTSEISIPVSVKLRLGVDEFDSYEFFRDFVGQLDHHGGVGRFIVHARKALLDGVTTRQNRLDELVPLRHEWVYALKYEFPHLHIEINGGIKSIHDMNRHLAHPCGLDGLQLLLFCMCNTLFDMGKS